VVKNGEAIRAGVVNLSIGDAHLAVAKADKQLVAKYIKDTVSQAYEPSINVLFESVAQVCGANSIGIVLTGLGNDGAEGLLKMKTAGGITFAQTQASSVVYGMPRSAIELEAVTSVLSPQEMAVKVQKLVGVSFGFENYPSK
jgi:two-component system chemotaxis response regulator CheB